ncbi:GyrI-like domain-containing protein [Dyadobacter sp. CY312]|uniref:GyrI-like domain-containing protein n=1 Tax=Dyadobacter sp. CY312 TaxID=2907303 RepID=UPI001F1ECFAF|nr:GyrI-like domain-containing protein [Dyadobacter sp. CY312]MCE7042588.1 GyrI-like domain-containing protein [Dyadobacter sp. CY312]
MSKIDLTKTFKEYYTAKPKPELVHVHPSRYLSITGKGDPSEKMYQMNIQALYATAYHLKFNFKAKGHDFVVAKLEGLWWFDDAKFGGVTMADAPKLIPRSEWEYRLLIQMPEFVSESDILAAKDAVLKKKGIPFVENISFFGMNEGKSVQMLHVGPFSNEPETLAVMMQFIQKNNFGRNGLHHEIYLSDFNKTAPEKLKTILREPVI